MSYSLWEDAVDDRTPPRVQRTLGLLALLTVLVLSGAACGDERASEQGSQEPSAEKSADSYCASSDGSAGWGFVDVVQPVGGGSEVKRDGQLEIMGWAATPAGSPPVERVEVNVEGQAVGPVSECIAREDLAQNLGEDARYGGWQVTADMRNIEVSGPTAGVSAEAIDRDGDRHPLPASNPELAVSD